MGKCANGKCPEVQFLGADTCQTLNLIVITLQDGFGWDVNSDRKILKATSGEETSWAHGGFLAKIAENN